MNKIEGAEALTQIFGYWPSFHDAEVMTFECNRDGFGDYDGPTVTAAVHLFEMTSEIAPEGNYAARHHTLARLRFFEVQQIQFDGFNHQNALFGLRIVDISDRQMERVKFEVSFDAAFGVQADFQCLAVEVISAEPFEPTS